jgi:GTP pyrophosphokinase
MELNAKILEKAIVFAIEKHKGQVRKGDGRPYILHPLTVLETLHKIKKSRFQFLLAVVAVLHDVVEDCKVPLEEIAKEFGHHVASLVGELTSDKKEIEKIGKEVYLTNKMIAMSNFALRLKLIDRLVNLIDTESMDNEFKEKTVKHNKYIISGLKNSGRKLTKTHIKIIKLIEKEIKKVEKTLNKVNDGVREKDLQVS